MTRPEPRRDFHVVDAVVVPRRSRLRTGFHRLGLVLAIPPALVGLVCIFLAAFAGEGQRIETIVYGCLWLAGAAILYGLVRLLSWVLAGFFGD